MAKTLIEVFDDHLRHLKFNQALANKIYRMQVAFVNKNEEHMAFFGGKLLGVHVVRFTERDFSMFYDDVVNADPDRLRVEIIEEVKDINENYKVSSDVFNLTCFYLIHKFLTTPLLDERKRHQAAKDVALLFNYRWIASFIREYFRFPADPRLAQMTYVNLSNRFLIKKLGSWQEVMAYRAEETIAKESIHYDTLLRFNNDLGIVYAVNDSQGRVRDIVKNVYAEMMKTHQSGEKIYSTGSTTIDSDGMEIVKDRAHGVDNYINYLFSVLPDRNSFVKRELVNVVVNVMHTMQERGFVKVLEWMSAHSTDRQDIELFVKSVMIHSFTYLTEHVNVLKNKQDLAGLLTKLKGVYISSRSSDPELLKLRETGSDLIFQAIGKTNEQTVAAIRTGLFLYICLRAYTKHHYSG